MIFDGGRKCRHHYYDGRAPATQIAEAIGADVRIVRNRIARLMDSGVVRLTAITDPSAFDYVIVAD